MRAAVRARRRGRARGRSRPARPGPARRRPGRARRTGRPARAAAGAPPGRTPRADTPRGGRATATALYLRVAIVREELIRPDGGPPAVTRTPRPEITWTWRPRCAARRP